MLVVSHLATLNSAQRRAVTHGEAVPDKGWRAGPLLVVAGAGTGKTTTIAYRVAQLMLHGVDPARLLVAELVPGAFEGVYGRVRAEREDTAE